MVNEDTVNPRISAPPYGPKLKINAPLRISAPLPSPRFCGRVMRQQRMYSFPHVVLDLYIVSVCENIK